MGKIGIWMVDKYRDFRKKSGKPPVPAERLRRLRRLYPSADPEKLSREQDGKLVSRAGRILLAGSAVWALAGIFGTGRREISVLERPAYGSGAATYYLEVEREGGDLEELEVSVGEQRLTDEEKERVLEEAYQEILRLMPGENESLENVSLPLFLPDEAAGGLAEAQWTSENRELLDDWGGILKEPGEMDPEGEEGTYLLTLFCGEEIRTYEIPVQVFPPEQTGEEQFLSGLGEELEKSLEADGESGEAQLPSSYRGEALTWYEAGAGGEAGWIIFLAVLAALWTAARAGQSQKEALKAREKQMLLDYPELVSKFTVLLQAGLSPRNVWERMVSEYEEKKRKGAEPRYAWEEMRITKNQLDNGVYESQAYGEFGRRCGLHAYMKFGALLEQNLRQGSTKLSLRLKEEAEESFEERKNMARRLGEEAETKLMLPMFLMLLVVLTVIMVPGFLSF